jgi:2-keto-4-pentenoate hydratase/2-oxohepta-3-ene-1,7-dioic acid hydratase in catechol pathway
MSPLPFSRRPGKVIAVGLNYRQHASEADVEVLPWPVTFAKFPSCLIGPGEPIAIPPGLVTVDYEAELAVIIGKTARMVSRDDALGYVAGYTCLNDVTDRATQTREGQWSRSKSFDTFGPVGPAVVPAAAIADPQALAIRARLNGQVMQDASTSQMIHGVADLIAFLSHGMTLEAGDVIATGTPSGVGAFRDPPVYLRPGDQIEIEIEGIGVLSNPVVAARG